MLKKVVLGILLTVLVGAAVLGAYSYWRSSTYGPAGRGRHAAAAYYDGDLGRPVAERGHYGQGRGYENDESGRGRGGGYGLPLAQVDEWLTASGEIVALEQSGLTVQTADGQTLFISLGPSRFWESRDTALKVGEMVTVHYFADDGELKAGEVTIEATGDRLLLRDSAGRPLWAGRGQGQGSYGM